MKHLQILKTTLTAICHFYSVDLVNWPQNQMANGTIQLSDGKSGMENTTIVKNRINYILVKIIFCWICVSSGEIYGRRRKLFFLNVLQDGKCVENIILILSCVWWYCCYLQQELFHSLPIHDSELLENKNMKKSLQWHHFLYQVNGNNKSLHLLIPYCCSSLVSHKSWKI